MSITSVYIFLLFLLLIIIFLAFYSKGAGILIWHFITSLFGMILLTIGQSAAVRNISVPANFSIVNGDTYQEGVVAAWQAVRALYPDVIMAMWLPFVGLLIVHIVRRNRR